jgi:hypothetical protein
MSTRTGGSLYRSKGMLILGTVGALGACQGSAPPQTVTVYAPTTCPGAPLASELADYMGTGDFAPPQTELVSLTTIGRSLGSLTSATRSIVVDVADVAPGSVVWAGVSLVGATGPVNVLALPLETACPLTPLAGSLGDTAGPSLGIIDSTHAVIVGGPLNGEPQTAYAVDVGTGELAAATNAPGTLSRDFGTVSPFAGGFLVAGGQGMTEQDPQDPITANAYQAGSGGPGDFVATQQITLSPPGRIKHAAVALANGEVLLVGGQNPTTLVPLDTLELVSAASPNSMPVSGTLEDPRVSPVALRLPTGNILVGGGFVPAGAPGPCEMSEVPCSVSTVEWFDNTMVRLSTLDLCGLQAAACCSITASPAFAPLEGGAVLVVLGPPPPPPQGRTPDCYNVAVLHDDFTAELAPLAGPTATVPRLFAGALSEPVLFADDGAWRWQPWNNTFTPLPSAAEGLNVPVASVSPDVGLALWLGNDSRVWSMRFDTRNLYATDPGTTLLLDTNTSEFAPDRLVNVADLAGDIDVVFQSGVGVTLQNGASVFLTDATFLDVSIVFMAAGPLSLALRDNDTGDELDVYSGHCLPSTLPKGKALQVERKGGSVSAGIAGNVLAPCAGAPPAGERVAVGFRALPGDEATVSLVSVNRLGPAN